MFSAKLWLSPKYSHIKPNLKCGSSSKLKMFVLLSASFLIWTTVVAAEEQIDKRPRMNFTLWLSSSFCLTNSVTPKENYYRFISEKSLFFFVAGVFASRNDLTINLPFKSASSLSTIVTLLLFKLRNCSFNTNSPTHSFRLSVMLHLSSCYYESTNWVGPHDRLVS